MRARVEVLGLLLLLAALLASACGDDDDDWVDPDPEGVSILPLGDSITQGDSEHQSYRYPLWTMLVDGGHDFDFVGSLTDNYEGNPTWPDHTGLEFDRDHEGHWGWHANHVLDELPGWLAGYTPEIALVHLGSNDVFNDQPAAEIAAEIGEIVETLRDDNPQLVVLLAQLIPTSYAETNVAIEDLNQELEVVASEHQDEGSPIVLVDHWDGFDADLDTHDGIHPNESGEQKMAAKWLAAIEPYL
jgi:lysophospholipase L1-like esterase